MCSSCFPHHLPPELTLRVSSIRPVSAIAFAGKRASGILGTNDPILCDLARFFSGVWFVSRSQRPVPAVNPSSFDPKGQETVLPFPPTFFSHLSLPPHPTTKPNHDFCHLSSQFLRQDSQPPLFKPPVPPPWPVTSTPQPPPWPRFQGLGLMPKSRPPLPYFPPRVFWFIFHPLFFMFFFFVSVHIRNLHFPPRDFRLSRKTLQTRPLSHPTLCSKWFFLFRPCLCRNPCSM